MNRRQADSGIVGTQPWTAPVPSFTVNRSWAFEGLCVGRMDEYDTRPDGSNVTPTEAARLCAGCPVMMQCLNEALKYETGGTESRNGVLGGLTPAQRSKLSKGRPLGCRHGHDPKFYQDHGRNHRRCSECDRIRQAEKRARLRAA